jgi:hypothetical protein
MQMARTTAMIEIEKQKAALGANADTEVKPNKRFKNFNDVFSGLTKSRNVITVYPIISMIITYTFPPSTITVIKKNDREYWIKQYSLETYKLSFEEKLGGKENSYIKFKEVEQSPSGDFYCAAYLDDGIFKIRTFGQTTRTQEEIDAEEFNVNEHLQIDNYTMPIQNFPDPFITCAVINKECIFVNFFHNATLTHHHFFYWPKKREITSHTTVKLDSNNKNFPYRCFYNPD